MARTPLWAGDPSRIGRYRLVARLGAGGMGVVYLGTVRDGGQVAVKVPRPELADDQEFRARFRREVAVLARVGGLCTVRVIEADTESANPFLATEYAEGLSLSEYVAVHGPMTSQMLYGLATGLAEALKAIHAAGVVHRDLKPGNVILTEAGPKVIDFGIAQALDGTAVTRTGMTVGSPGFIAPEQITGQAGPLADVFSWGLTVAYAASGQQPFGTGPTDAIMYRILHDSPDVAAVPSDLRPVVEAALAKSPTDRPAARDLLGRLTSQAGQPGTPDNEPTQSVLSRTWLLPAPERPAVARGPRRFRLLPLLTGAVAFAVVAGAGGAYLVGSSGTRPLGGLRRPVLLRSEGLCPPRLLPDDRARLFPPRPASQLDRCPPSRLAATREGGRLRSTYRETEIMRRTSTGPHGQRPVRTGRAPDTTTTAAPPAPEER